MKSMLKCTFSPGTLYFLGVAIEQLRTTVGKNIDMFCVEVIMWSSETFSCFFSVGPTSATTPNFQYIHKCLLNGPAGG